MNEYPNIVMRIAYGTPTYRTIAQGRASTQTIIGKDANGQLWTFSRTNIHHYSGFTTIGYGTNHNKINALPPRNSPEWWFNPYYKDESADHAD